MEEVREYVKVKHVPKDERIFRLSKSFLYHEMRRGCALAGTKAIRIHGLRCSHASLLIELGYSVPARPGLVWSSRGFRSAVQPR